MNEFGLLMNNMVSLYHYMFTSLEEKRRVTRGALCSSKILFIRKGGGGDTPVVAYIENKVG